MDQLERIIELQQEQINRYDEYIRLFIDSRNVNVNKKSHILVPWKKTINENALKFTDDQILNIFENKYPADIQISEFIFNLMDGYTFSIEDKIVSYINSNNQKKNMNENEFANKVCTFIFEKYREIFIKNSDRNKPYEEDQIEMDTNIMKNVMILRTQKQQCELFKKVVRLKNSNK